MVDGRIPACVWVVQACQRQIADLRRQRRKDWPYRFDAQLGARVCRFLEQLPHIKGPLAGQRIRLEPWQCWIVSTLFGWVRKDTGKRRFRRAYIEVPRGNAKSTLSSGLALYCLAADGEGGAEVYSAATTRDQARIVFKAAQRMVKKSPALADRLGIQCNAHAIVHEESGSIFQALSAEAATLEGLNIHFAVIDELHAHPTREVYDVVETGTGKREQSLLLAITTAGSDTAGICYEIRGDLLKVLGKVYDDESFFGVVYSWDEDDLWTATSSHIKANPNWGVSVMPEVIGQLCAKAERNPAAQANFQMKHGDRWKGAAMAFINPDDWAKCGDETLREGDFVHDDCMAAVDLASRDDIASVVKIYRRDLEDGPHYFAFWRNYLPEATIAEARNSQYGGWAETGRMLVTSGETIDFATIEDDLVEDCDHLRVLAVGYDPWQAQSMSQTLKARISRQIQVVEWRNTVATMSEPMKELGALVREGRFHHDGDPVAAWAASNVVAAADRKENIYPRKERPANKIDPIVAAIIALGLWLKLPAERESVYNAPPEQPAPPAPPAASTTTQPASPAARPGRARSIYDSPEWANR